MPMHQVGAVGAPNNEGKILRDLEARNEIAWDSDLHSWGGTRGNETVTVDTSVKQFYLPFPKIDPVCETQGQNENWGNWS